MERRQILNPLLTKVDMDMNYLSTLDYIDMRTLCISSKQLSHICRDNTSLRSIIYNKNDYIEISPNFNISGALKDIYASIQKVIDDNYREETLPRWVNKKLFNDDMLRNFMNYFLEEFINQIIDIYLETEQEPFPQINKIELFKPLVAVALYSNEIEYDEFECLRTDVPNTIIIPKSFYEYIIHTVNKLAEYTKYDDDDYEKNYDDYGDDASRGYYHQYYRILLKALSDMLFVKH